MDATSAATGQAPLTALTEAARERALARFRVLRPHLEDGVPLTHVAQTAAVPVRTLQRWTAAYRQAGLAGLARKPRTDRHHPHLPTALIALIEGLALRTPRAAAATIHRRVVTVAQDRGWPTPAYSTVTARLRGLDPALVALAHEGAKAYAETFDLIQRREASGPNAIWQADHTPLDLWVRDHRGQPARPWLTVIMDDYSRAIAGYALNLTAPSSLQTALALRQAIGRKGEAGWHICGIPAVFYTDHGSDFTSRHLEQVAADLHMQLVFSLVGVPRGRGKIERFFGTVSQLFLGTLPGYTPAGTPPPAAPPLTLSELEARLRTFLIEDYHQRLHGETHARPQERWDAGGFLPRLPDSPEQLDLLLLTVATPRQVHPDGIHFQGLRYLDLTLAAYVGEAVTIRYDPRDLAELRVYHRDRFLCRAICPELAGQTIALKDLIRARTERRRALRGTLTEREQLVRQYLAVHDPPPEQAPAAPTDDAAPPRPRLKRYRNE
jgi:putative transposase